MPYTEDQIIIFVLLISVLLFLLYIKRPVSPGYVSRQVEEPGEGNEPEEPAMTGTVSGTIYYADHTTPMPVKDPDSIEISDTTTTTDDEGRYSVELAPGNYTINVKVNDVSVGQAGISVETGVSQTVDVVTSRAIMGVELDFPLYTAFRNSPS